MSEHFSVLVVGGGQAGLAVSWHLSRDGIDHLVLERDTMMHNWRDARWDSFCLVTPNWQCQLPGYGYAGPDPDGFMVAAELNEWLSAYPRSFGPPVREGAEVHSVRRGASGFDIATSAGNFTAGQVVVATGGYHKPALPALSHKLAGTQSHQVEQLHSSAYRNAQALPAGPVLVVGTGQSGAQIAEDLQLAGRQVHLAVGSAPRVARSYRGRDVVAWLADMGHYDKPVTDQPVADRHRDRTNHYVTGRDGGRDIDLRHFAQQGMQLHGHLLDVTDGMLHFADDLAANLNQADEVYNGINAAIDGWIELKNLDVKIPASRYESSWTPEPGGQTVPVTDLAAVVWATGFHNDYRWLQVGVFDGAGHPQHLRGVTEVDGLYFIGLPWLHSWGSGRFAGVARDAQYLAGYLRANAPQRSGLAAAHN